MAVLGSLTQDAHYQALKAHVEKTPLNIADLFASDPLRWQQHHVIHENVLFDFSRHRVDDKGMALLCQLAESRRVKASLIAMMTGEAVNRSEQRQVCHTRMRDPAYWQQSTSITQTFFRLVKQIRSGAWVGSDGARITDVVNIGIGGSDLGPRLLYDALHSQVNQPLRCHFVASDDPPAFIQAVAGLNPKTTLFLVVSKSFSTVETLSNAKRAKAWCLASGMPLADLEKHFIAVSSHVEAARDFGIAKNAILPMDPGVGGRFSVWSAVGFSVALGLGVEAFTALLEGAHAMDKHAVEAETRENIPVLMALFSLYYRQCYATQSEAVVVYDVYLDGLVNYLQQLEMESLGKRLTLQNTPCDYPTGSVVWGGLGPNSQHSFHQLLMQGTVTVPVDMVLTGAADAQDPHLACANYALAQAQAMAMGNAGDRHHDPRAIPGNQPCSLLCLKTLTPRALGSLIAAYEHKTAALAALLDINAFDQFGVEFAKGLARDIETGTDAMAQLAEVRNPLHWLGKSVK